jgi:putative ABC transport system permease protein
MAAWPTLGDRMLTADVLGFTLRALGGARTRTILMLLAMSVGVSSVILLTALGEGARRYVRAEFQQLGTHLLVLLPGRSETTGGAPPLLGETPRDLTLQDALALLRSRYIRRIAPIVVGNAPVSFGNLEREVTVIGTTADFFPVRQIGIMKGRALPGIDPERVANVGLLGTELKRELFGNRRALGHWVRVGDRRIRVIGILAKEGQSLGQDLGDMLILPLATAQSLFNAPSLFRVLIQARNQEDIPSAKAAALQTIRERHDGEDDVTIITQDALLSTFDGILRSLTYTVGGIAAISLSVAGILIMNVMLVAVSQRTSEIGLLKALGASRRQIHRLFLIEAAILASAGALTGAALAAAALALARYLVPTFPLAAPLWAPLAAIGVALTSGLVFGLMPARRAAGLDPVRALSGR